MHGRVCAAKLGLGSRCSSDGHSSHHKYGTSMGGRKADHDVAPPRINDSDGEQELVIMATESVVPQMTYAEFQRWKQQKDAEAAAKAAEAARKRAEDIAQGRVRMNGRELYHAEPWVFDDSRFE